MSNFQPGQQIKHYQINEQIGSGGFAMTYRVIDSRNGQLKVLKVLNSQRTTDSKSLQWFEQEAKILQRLNHPGISSVQEDDGYFTYELADDQLPLHCFVMEWINGQNLHEYVQQQKQKKIDQEQAIDWLKQLIEILAVVHQENFFHRDIKPENILTRYTNQRLVLIDFGIARQESQTFYDKKKRGKNLTNVGTPGYQAPEVERGDVCKQSDFFSLGRTFVFLTTGKPIRQFSQDEQGNLNWHDDAPQLSAQFKELLDWLMKLDPVDRPRDTQELLNYLNVTDFSDMDGMETTQFDARPALRPDKALARLSQKIMIAIASALLSTIAIVGVRYVGLLQSTELAVFDQMMRSRSLVNTTVNSPDNHILIVESNEQDSKRYGTQPNQSKTSMNDESLLKLLKILNRDQASIIGLDIIRDFPTQNPELKKLLKVSTNLYSVCIPPSPEHNQPGVEKSPDITVTQVGFANMLEESGYGKVVRRQLLARKAEATGCQAENSFALLVAFDYLFQQGRSIDEDGDCEFWHVGQTQLPFLRPYTGFYLNEEAKCMILLNSRLRSASRENFSTVTLSQLLDEDVPKEQIVGKIVLIGTTDPGWEDTDWVLPSQSDKMTAGVFVQAEMVSHLVGIGLGERQTLRFWPLWQDALWIAVWAMFGSTIVLLGRSRPTFVALGLFGLAGLSITAAWFFFLQLGILVATVPTILAISFSSLNWLVYGKLAQRT